MTTAAGIEPSVVSTERILWLSSASNPVTAVPVRTSMPMPSMARCTAAPMSGSSVVIGCAA